MINSLVLAEVGSGKSTAITLMKQSLKDVEQFLSYDPYTLNSATIESLIHELSKRKQAISFYDEATQFTGMFGRYSSSVKPGNDYDSGVFLDLASAPNSFQKDIKSGPNPNTFIENPRYNVALAGHSRRFKDELVKERQEQDYGFYKRILVNSAPMGLFMAEDLMSAKEIECELSLIFLFMKLLNEYSVEYKFDEDATAAFNEIYNKTRLSMKMHENKDSNICGLMSKAQSWILKLCVVLQNLHSAYDFVLDTIQDPSKRTLNNENLLLIQRHFENQETIEAISTIKSDMLGYAFNMTSYYFKQSMILSDYDYEDWQNENIFEICSRIHQAKVSEEASSAKKKQYDGATKRTAKFILVNKFRTIKANSVNQFVSKVTVKEIKNIFVLLQTLGFGTVTETQNARGPKTISFKKQKVEQIVKNRQLVDHLIDLEIDFDQIKDISQYSELEMEMSETADTSKAKSTAAASASVEDDDSENEQINPSKVPPEKSKKNEDSEEDKENGETGFNNGSKKTNSKRKSHEGDVLESTPKKIKTVKSLENSNNF